MKTSRNLCLSQRLNTIMNETEKIFGNLQPNSNEQSVILFIIGFLMIITIIVGNFLVILAIIRDNTLKNLQNWFIASLAFADILLGMVVVPFSLVQEVLGQWIFGYYWCQFHAALDVFLCTSSILNLCLISLDRYWSVTQPATYIKFRTEQKVGLLIVAVWLLSMFVSLPPLLVDSWAIPYPYNNTNTWMSNSTHGNDIEDSSRIVTCHLSQDYGYILYSCLGSFYIPSTIMVYVNFKIYFAIRARTRRHDRNETIACAELSTKNYHIDEKICKQDEANQNLIPVEGKKNQNAGAPPTTTVTSITANNGKKFDIGTLEKKRNTAVSTTVPVVDRKKIAREKERRATIILGLIVFAFILCWLPFFFLYIIDPLCPVCVDDNSTKILGAEDRVPKINSDNDSSGCCVQPWIFSLAFWLGYSNSVLNPIIYTVFNEDFRKAFVKILTKC